MSRPASRVCFVIHRYGRGIPGGAETLCREVALRLSGRYALTVLSTCAEDYLTWENRFPPGERREDGLTVVRFLVDRPRKVRSFGRLSVKLFGRPHRLSEEVDWMEKQGPDSPALLRFIQTRRGDFDLFVFFTYLYATTFFGLALAPERSILVPMAHPEEPLGFGLFRYLFHLPRGFIFNTPEERDLVHERFGCAHIPHTVAGVGIDLPPAIPAAPPVPGGAPYLLYLGRVDIQKGLDELFDFHRRYLRSRPGRNLELLLAGDLKMRLPSHPAIRYLGYVPEAEKGELLAGAAAAVVPSPHESLSITALEAWARSRPVLANGRSAVLAGQCQRSGGGLAYTDYDGFEAGLDRLLSDTSLVAELGRRGREFVARDYAWEVVEGAYVRFIDAAIQRINAT